MSAACLREGQRFEPERAIAQKLGVAVQLVPRELHQQALVAVEVGLRGLVPHLELLAHFVVEVLQQLLARARHRFVDLEAQFELELVEGGLDLVGLAAALVDGGDALLEVDAGLDRAEHLVAGAEDALEELELLGQQLEDALVGRVLAVEEVDDHHVVLLAVAVAAADALLDALRVPRQVVVHHQRAELQVDALGAGLGGDHDAALLAEVVHQRGAHVGGARAGDAVGALVALEPSA